MASLSAAYALPLRRQYSQGIFPPFQLKLAYLSRLMVSHNASARAAPQDLGWQQKVIFSSHPASKQNLLKHCKDYSVHQRAGWREIPSADELNGPFQGLLFFAWIDYIKEYRA